MRHLRPLAIGIALALFASRPAAAQAIGFNGLPWGSDARATIASVTAAGLRLDAESPGDGGDLVFLGPDGVSMRAMLADGRLVAVHTIIPVPGGNMQPVFQSMRTDFVGRYGEPVEEHEAYAGWEDGETALALAADVDSGGAYVTVLLAGPGYRAEHRRRSLAAGTLYPALEPRWTTVETSIASRTAWDRVTAASPGPGLRRVWLRTDYADVADDPAPHNVLLTHLDVDCPRRRLRVVSAVYRLDDAVAQRYNPAQPDAWQPGEPESIGEVLLTALCRDR